MQSLWTRAAQIRCTCNCTFCHSTTPALNRRPTSAALRGRLRFRDVFTVFYPTVLAYATIADGSRKEAKKTEWELLIKEARDDLKALEEQQQARLEAVSVQNGDSDRDSSHDRTSQPSTWGDVFEWASQERDRRQALGFGRVKGYPLNLLEDLNIPEIETVLLDKFITRLNSPPEDHFWHTDRGSRDFSVKKVKTLEWSIRKLAFCFLLSSIERSEKQVASSPDSSLADRALHPFSSLSKLDLKERIEDSDQRLQFLGRHSSNREYWYRFKSPDLPNYSRLEQMQFTLNDKIYELFGRFHRHTRKKDLLITNIGVVLLLSYTPPDIQTYNTLIINLTRLKQMDEVELVIASMRECHVRPNEFTLSALLKFYIVTNNIAGFIGLLEEMDGKDGGLALAHPASEVNPVFAERYVVQDKLPVEPTPVSEQEKDFYYEENGREFKPPGFKPRADVHSERRVVQRAAMTYINRVVYGTIIHGALKFFGVKVAMQFYIRMVKDGWEVGRKALGAILYWSCERQLWGDGLAAWREMCKLPEGADSDACAWMLQLCRSHKQYILFGQVLDYGVRHNFIEPSVWLLPGNRIFGMNFRELVQAASDSALQLIFVRKSLQRITETLSYRIASLALEVAEMTQKTDEDISESVGWRLYIRIRRMHASILVGPERRIQVLQLFAKKQGMDPNHKNAIKIPNEEPSEPSERHHPMLKCGRCAYQSHSATKLHKHIITCPSYRRVIVKMVQRQEIERQKREQIRLENDDWCSLISVDNAIEREPDQQEEIEMTPAGSFSDLEEVLLQEGGESIRSVEPETRPVVRRQDTPQYRWTLPDYFPVIDGVRDTSHCSLSPNPHALNREQLLSTDQVPSSIQEEKSPFNLESRLGDEVGGLVRRVPSTKWFYIPTSSTQADVIPNDLKGVEDENPTDVFPNQSAFAAHTESSADIDLDMELSSDVTKKGGPRFFRSMELSLMAESVLPNDLLVSKAKPRLVLETEGERRFRFMLSSKNIWPDDSRYIPTEERESLIRRKTLGGARPAERLVRKHTGPILYHPAESQRMESNATTPL